MAHQLSFVDGRAEAAFAGRNGMPNPAWHGLGTYLNDVPNSEVMAEQAHLNWKVGVRPLQTVDGVSIHDHFATVRMDTGEVLGVVSDRYKVVQNHDAFAFLDGLLQDGVMKYESAGALRGGRTVWVLGRLPSVDEIAPGDNSLRYVLFSTCHDGTGSIHAIPTSTRVVCANTLRIASMNDVGIRHTGDVKYKMEIAKHYLSQFDEKFTLFRDKARLLAQKPINPEDAKAYIEELFPEVKEMGRTRSIRENKVDEVRRNYRNAKQSIASIKGTWWALVNAVTESIDHSQRRKYSGREGAENKMISTLDGSGADFKAKAFNLAISMAG